MSEFLSATVLRVAERRRSRCGGVRLRRLGGRTADLLRDIAPGIRKGARNQTEARTHHPSRQSRLGRLSGDQFCVYVANRLVIPG